MAFGPGVFTFRSEGNEKNSSALHARGSQRALEIYAGLLFIGTGCANHYRKCAVYTVHHGCVQGGLHLTTLPVQRSETKSGSAQTQRFSKDKGKKKTVFGENRARMTRYDGASLAQFEGARVADCGQRYEQHTHQSPAKLLQTLGRRTEQGSAAIAFLISSTYAVDHGKEAISGDELLQWSCSALMRFCSPVFSLSVRLALLLMCKVQN